MRIKETSQRLQEAMDQQHLRQVDIIEKSKPFCEKYDIKLHKVELSNYLKGRINPSQDKLALLAEILNVSEPWLMGYNVPKSRKASEEIKEEEKLVNIDFQEDGELIVRVKLDPEQNKMNILLNKLNAEGKKEAFKRVEELSFIPKFIKKEEK